MTTATEEVTFQAWPKIARLNREVLITEKIDGTNAAIGVTPDGEVYAQSRTRIITPENDNFGFAGWVYQHGCELADELGPGVHFGEWWGSGIQRGYGLPKGERRFSLFNAIRWEAEAENGWRYSELLHVVPTLYVGVFDTARIDTVVENIRSRGSRAAPFMNPEGIVVYHKAANTAFKVTLDNDDEHKGKQ